MSRFKFWDRVQDTIDEGPLAPTPPEWLSEDDPKRVAAERKAQRKEKAVNRATDVGDVVFSVFDDGPVGLVIGGVALLGFGGVKLTRWALARRHKD